MALPDESALLAGAGGLGRAVTWARLLRARPATLGTIEPGELWLISPGALSQTSDLRAMARMVRDLVEAGVVGFVVVDPPGEDALAEAERAALPVVQVPAATPLAELERGIVSFLVDRDGAIRARVQAVYDRLLATLVEDGGPEVLVGIVHQVTGHAVYVLDEHFQPAVQAGGDAASTELVAQARRRFWEEPTPGWEERPFVGRGETAAAALAAVVRPLVLRGTTEGFLALVGPRDAFTDFDHEVATRTASVLAIEQAKQSAAVEAHLRVQGDFLADLLDTRAPMGDALLARARSLGYNLSRRHAVFVLRPRLAGLGRSRSARHYQRFLDQTCRRLLLGDLATLLREHDGTVQVVAPYPEGMTAADPDATAGWVERIRSELEAALAPESVPLTAGVGRSPDEGITFHTAIREAMQAAEIATTLPVGPSTLHYARLGALRLIFLLADHPEIGAFRRDAIGPLEEYDRVHRSELVQTLDAFFRAGGNHMQTARDLHVHRNTLLYRLERIREVLGGVDLDDPDARLNLQLALKIRAALGGEAQGPVARAPGRDLQLLRVER